MHGPQIRQEALKLLADGWPRADVCRLLRVSPQSTYRWQERAEPLPGSSSNIQCFRCDGTKPNGYYYLYLLGQYLGDGHIANVQRTTALRIYCCDDYPEIITQVGCAMFQVANASVNYREFKNSRCTQVQSSTQHWKCMIPQHGPGMKHTRPIALTDWQKEMVATDPRPLIKGLIHSDGCRGMNTVHRSLPSGVHTYSYPRYLFSNVSTDIQGIYTDALDILGIAWKRNRWNSISVARREAVAALDEFVGPKS